MRQSTVLFVDDEPKVTMALKRALAREPYEMLSASSGKDGLEVLAGRNVDVVVSDEQMPGMSGSEFLSVVCREYPLTIRMMLTGQASLDAAICAINEGEVYRFFRKPCDPSELKVSIRQALLYKQVMEKSRQLVQKTKRQAAIIEDLEQSHPGISRLNIDEEGAILVEEVEEELEELLVEMGW